MIGLKILSILILVALISCIIYTIAKSEDKVEGISLVTLGFMLIIPLITILYK